MPRERDRERRRICMTGARRRPPNGPKGRQEKKKWGRSFRVVGFPSADDATPRTRRKKMNGDNVSATTRPETLDSKRKRNARRDSDRSCGGRMMEPIAIRARLHSLRRGTAAKQGTGSSGKGKRHWVLGGGLDLPRLSSAPRVIGCSVGELT